MTRAETNISLLFSDENVRYKKDKDIKRVRESMKRNGTLSANSGGWGKESNPYAGLGDKPKRFK